MAITESDVLKVIKTRLGIEGIEHDNLIQSYISEIGERIKAYCGIIEVPDALKFTWASMTTDLLRLENVDIPEVLDSISGGENVKIGDTSVSPTTDKSSNLQKKTIEEIVSNYKFDLNRYRRLGW